MSVGNRRQALGSNTYRIHQHAGGVPHNHRGDKKDESPSVARLRELMKGVKA